jgi:exodeoxyribonuclease VII small subunit
MEKENKTYDSAIKRIEQIVLELEQAETLSMSEYQKKAEEAKELLLFCQQQLTHWEKQVDILINPSL